MFAAVVQATLVATPAREESRARRRGLVAAAPRTELLKGMRRFPRAGPSPSLRSGSGLPWANFCRPCGTARKLQLVWLRFGMGGAVERPERRNWVELMVGAECAKSNCSQTWRGAPPTTMKMLAQSERGQGCPRYSRLGSRRYSRGNYQGRSFACGSGWQARFWGRETPLKTTADVSLRST
jgi:hypothetical protein